MTISRSITLLAVALLTAAAVAWASASLAAPQFQSETAKKIDALLQENRDLGDALDISAGLCPLSAAQAEEASREMGALMESMDSVRDYWFSSNTSLLDWDSWGTAKPQIRVRLNRDTCWAAYLPPGDTLAPPAAMACREGICDFTS